MSDQHDNLFCDLTIFTDEERQQHLNDAEQLLAQVIAVESSAMGYALRFSDTPQIIQQIAQFISEDRKCCPFIHFSMDVEANGAGIWLHLKGDTAVKQAIKSEFFSSLPDHLVKTL